MPGNVCCDFNQPSDLRQTKQLAGCCLDNDHYVYKIIQYLTIRQSNTCCKVAVTVFPSVILVN